jgi:hypothetical protein
VLDKLRDVINDLPSLLREGEWNSLRVDYNHPYVDRLWRQFDQEHRVLLHRIHPCETEQALLHPHPWPSAMRVLGPGSYETGIGYGDPTGEAPPIAAKFRLKNLGSYEMVDPNTWHYVRPIQTPVYTVMTIGRPFDTPKQDRFGQLREHSPLGDEEKIELLRKFRWFFSF